MKLFSERYGYTKPSDIIIREEITPEIRNAICSCFDKLPERFQTLDLYYGDNPYYDMEKYLWTYFLNQRENEFRHGNSYHIVATAFIEDENNPWYKKLDLLEVTINYLYSTNIEYDRNHIVVKAFVAHLNFEFERLNFAYRIVDQKVVEITSQVEIQSIEQALHDSENNIQMHLGKALDLYSKRPTADYSNSIKESISAVEAYCRQKTGENTLGKALKKLEANKIIIPNILKDAFEKLYAYTNQPETGIRHALMEKQETYIPKAEEALFMLVSCSAFINYLNNKVN